MNGQIPTGCPGGKFETALDCVRACARESGRSMKTVAADMGLSPSDLSRKLANKPQDPRRFTLNDLESFMQATGDYTPVLFLVQKYMPNLAVGERVAAAVALRAAVPQLQALLRAAGAAE